MGEGKKSDPEFLAEALRRVRDPARTVADVARSFRIHVNTMHTWRAQA